MNKNHLRFITYCYLITCLSLFSSLSKASATQEVFVDPLNGLDSTALARDGSMNKPFQTIKYALKYAEKSYNSGVSKSLRSAYTVLLRGGNYDEVLEKISIKGTLATPITIAAYDGERVTFDGSIMLTGAWQSHGKNIYSQHVGKDIWQLFEKDGNQWQQKMNARWPNARFGEKTVDIESVYSRESWAHANKTGNVIGAMVDDSLVDDSNINTIDLTGAIVVANVGSFNSWTRKITAHGAGNRRFEYGATPTIWKSQQHFYYFVQNKLELLDNDDEWYFDTITKRAYIYSSTGAPTGTYRGKHQPYGINVSGWQHVTVKDINFFSSTLKCANCDNFTLENSNFEFGGSSRRALGQVAKKPEILLISSNIKDLAYRSNNTLRNVSVKNVDGQGLIMRGNGSIIENCYFKNIDWAATETYAPSSSLVLDGNYSLFRYNTVETAGTSETLATKGASPVGSGKYTGPDGGVITAEYNEISHTGFAQNDGAIIQLRIAAQRGSILRYNWLHDSNKYGLRFDAPIPAARYGSEAIAHHNVIWNANGMMIKGEDQRVYHNTVFHTLDPKRTDLIILDDSNVGGIKGGGNNGSRIINNAAETISSQRASIDPIPSWVDFGANFNGIKQAVSLVSQLKDVNSHDFRPIASSALVDGDEITDSYLTQLQGDAFSYTGAYRPQDPQYWIPGRRLVKPSHPIPALDTADATLTADLIWRPAYNAIAHKVYFGTSTASLSLKTQTVHNIVALDSLDAGTTYYWRVDAMMASGDTVTGDIWRFVTAGESGATDDNNEESNEESPTVNNAPTLELSAQSVKFDENSQVVIESQASDSDGDPLTYYWQQIIVDSETAIILSDDTTPQLSFTAPQVTRQQQFTFRLTVSDSSLSVSAEVIIVVADIKPIPQKPEKPTIQESVASGSFNFYLLLVLAMFIWRREQH